jgi:hypothetical protein
LNAVCAHFFKKGIKKGTVGGKFYTKAKGKYTLLPIFWISKRHIGEVSGFIKRMMESMTSAIP